MDAEQSKLKVLREIPSNEDYIDMSGVVDLLETAIEDDTRFIALFGGYAAGKSTVIGLLKKRLKDKGICKRIPTINLWSGLQDNQTKEELAHSFLLQLAQTLDKPYQRQYVTRRLNKRYGLISLSFKRRKPVIISLIAIAIFTGMVAFASINFGINLSWISSFASSAWFGSVLIILLVFIVGDIAIARSTRSSDGGVDTDDFLEVYLYLCEQLPDENKHVIVIDDLDRITTKSEEYSDPVNNQLVDFLCYLHSLICQVEMVGRKNSITYVVPLNELVMGEERRSQGNEQHDRLSDFSEKVFEYTIRIPPIYQDDLRTLLEDYLNENAAFYKYWGMVNNSEEGKRLTIPNVPGSGVLLWGYPTMRSVKQRINRANELFYTLARRFHSDQPEGYKVRYSNCCAVALLANEYPAEFKCLNEARFQEIIKKSICEGIPNWEECVKSCWGNINNEGSQKDDFIRDFAKLLSMNYIDATNYPIYFFNTTAGRKNRKPAADLLYRSLLYSANDENIDIAVETCTEEELREATLAASDYLDDTDQELPLWMFRYPEMVICLQGEKEDKSSDSDGITRTLRDRLKTAEDMMALLTWLYGEDNRYLGEFTNVRPMLLRKSADYFLAILGASKDNDVVSGLREDILKLVGDDIRYLQSLYDGIFDGYPMPAITMAEAISERVDKKNKLKLLSKNASQAEDAVIAEICEPLFKEKYAEAESVLIRECLKDREAINPQSEVLVKTALGYFIWCKRVDDELLNPITQKISESEKLQKLLFDGYGNAKGAGLCDSSGKAKSWQLTMLDQGAYKLRLNPSVARSYLKMGYTREFFLIMLWAEPNKEIFKSNRRRNFFYSVADELLGGNRTDFVNLRFRCMKESEGRCLLEAAWMFDATPRADGGVGHPGYPEINLNEFEQVNNLEQLKKIKPTFSVIKWLLISSKFGAEDVAAYLDNPHNAQELSEEQKNEVFRTVYSKECKRLHGNRALKQVLDTWNVKRGIKGYLTALWNKSSRGTTI